jgi:hypothetical protein
MFEININTCISEVMGLIPGQTHSSCDRERATFSENGKEGVKSDTSFLKRNISQNFCGESTSKLSV